MTGVTWKRDRRVREQQGFTIVELLIATAVFGLVLLFVSTAVLQFSRVYYKGVTETNTQDAARGVMDRIGQAIQFDGGTVTSTTTPSPGTPATFCVGNVQYTYILGYQLTDSTPGTHQTNHALVMRNYPGCTASSPPSPMDLSATGQELLSPNMRLANLSVTNVPGTPTYRISIRVVFGDDTLLNGPTTTTANCIPAYSTGTQFCALSDLSTVVTKRVQ